MFIWKRAVAGDAPHFGIFGAMAHNAADFGANRRRIAVAHRAQTAGRDETARVFGIVILRGPHLMLAHIGGHNRFALRGFLQFRQHELRLQLAGFFVSQRRFLFPFGDAFEPRRVFLGAHGFASIA